MIDEGQSGIQFYDLAKDSFNKRILKDTGYSYGRVAREHLKCEYIQINRYKIKFLQREFVFVITKPYYHQT